MTIRLQSLKYLRQRFGQANPTNQDCTNRPSFQYLCAASIIRENWLPLYSDTVSVKISIFHHNWNEFICDPRQNSNKAFNCQDRIIVQVTSYWHNNNASRLMSDTMRHVKTIEHYVLCQYLPATTVINIRN